MTDLSCVLKRASKKSNAHVTNEKARTSPIGVMFFLWMVFWDDAFQIQFGGRGAVLLRLCAKTGTAFPGF